jgi:hypothetical protein
MARTSAMPGKGAKITSAGLAGGIAETDQHDVSHQRSGGSHVGSDSFGEEFGSARETALDMIASLIDIGIPIELDEDEGERDVIGGAQAGDTRDSHEGPFEGDGDAGFDFFRRGARNLGQDGDGGFGEVGKDLHG